MTSTLSVVMFGLCVAASVASADDAAKKPAEWKPAAEMKQLEGLLGTWSCEGYDNGKVAWHATAVNTPDMGGAWMKVMYDADAKPGEAPDGGHGAMGWDPDAKKLVYLTAGSNGSWHVSMSSGLEKDRIAFTMQYPKATPDRRVVFVLKDKDHIDLMSEQRTGKTWKSTLGQSCTRK